MSDFKSNLRKHRKLNNYTQTDLAAKVGVQRQTIIRLEAAKYNPSLKLAINLSRVLNVPIEELFVYE